MYYRINVIPCHKPWRGGENPIYTKDESVFKYFSEELEELYRYTAPESFYKKTEEDFDNCEDYEEYREKVDEEWDSIISEDSPEFPITIIDECWVYTE